MENLEDVALHLQRFSWPDYALFSFMLFLCILIGLYFGFIKPHTADAESEYLVGNRSMHFFPISLSLIASFISGITLLGLPSEVYLHGIQYVYVSIGVVLMGIIMATFYLPVFYGLEITSSYEYLEMRYSRKVRLFGSILFAVMNILYLPIVIYIPSLAFNQVTGINIHHTSWLVVIICVFYTCVGGLKAVVWTDVVQTFSMFLALILVAVKGTIDLKEGGIGHVIDSALNTSRLELPNIDINPLVRHTLWSQVLGGVFYWVQTNAVSQNMIQRYLSLPSLRAGRKSVWLFVSGVVILMMLCSYNGLLMYATYKNCDPLSTNLAKAKDQMLPLFVMQTLGELPGLSGLFIAGVFSAALSSLSTCLNSLSAVVLEDFIKPFTDKPLTDRIINWVMRSTVVIVGISSASMVYIVEKAGTVLQLTMSLEAITNGPLFGVFTLGIFLPWINSASALTGGISGVIFMSWLSFNAQYAIASGQMEFPPKDLAADQCPYSFIPSNSTIKVSDEYIFPLYKISYMWYTLVGAIFTMLVSLLCSIFIFGFNDPSTISSELLTPFLRKTFSKENEIKNERPIKAVKDTEF
ncbi:hypothetical protein ACKWTF_000279 [Chironomus riparius]